MMSLRLFPPTNHTFYIAYILYDYSYFENKNFRFVVFHLNDSIVLAFSLVLLTLT